MDGVSSSGYIYPLLSYSLMEVAAYHNNHISGASLLNGKVPMCVCMCVCAMCVCMYVRTYTCIRGDYMIN